MKIPAGKNTGALKKAGFRYLLAVTLLCGMKSYGQMAGIGTKTPAVTLDVVGSPGTASAMDGILPPRITGTQLRAKNYTASQTGAVVYVTNADVSPSGQTVRVTSSGYYYFDGKIWKKLARKIVSSDAASNYTLYFSEAALNSASIAASSPNHNTTVNNVDLGLKKTLTIPPRSTVKVLVNYNVPVISRAAWFRGFIGVNFLRNGTEMPVGSRKHTFAVGPDRIQSVFISIPGKFAETIINTADTPLSVTYSLNAYTEKVWGTVNFNSVLLENIVGGSVMEVTAYIKLDD